MNTNNTVNIFNDLSTLGIIPVAVLFSAPTVLTAIGYGMKIGAIFADSLNNQTTAQNLRNIGNRILNYNYDLNYEGTPLKILIISSTIVVLSQFHLAALSNEIETYI